MGVIGTIGKALGRVALGVLVSTSVLYVDYRLRGGPSVRRLYKEVKAERARAENAAKEDFVKAQIIDAKDFNVR